MSDPKVTLALPPYPDDRWELARQMGVDYAHPHTAMGESGLGSGDDRPDHVPTEYDDLLRLINAFENVGLEVPVVGPGGTISDTTRLGRPGRDDEIEAFCSHLRNVGAVGVPVVTYSWMSRFWWMRTDARVPLRGNSLSTAYDHEQSERGPPADVDVSETELWENLEYFLERVVPVAEEAGVKLALHPDDPPLSPVRGVPRIIRSPAAYERVLDLVESPANGISFCVGNFVAMGTDVPEMIRRFASDIHYAHFRDVEGTAEQFVETWHDEGPTDMHAVLRAFADVGYDGPIRPDHVPTMQGESNDRPGYEMKGRLFAVGYMRGLLESIDAEGS